MMNRNDDFSDLIDNDMYHSPQSLQQENEKNINISQEPPQYKSVNTFLGKMPIAPSYKEMTSPESMKPLVESALGALSGAPGMNIIGGIESGLKPLLSKGSEAIGKGIEYLQPGKTSQEFMQNIGGDIKGGLKTAEENISELSKRLNFSRNSAAKEALSYKEPVFEALGNRIVVKPETWSLLKNSDVPGIYSGDLKDAYSAFKSKPSLNNLDSYQQQLGDRIGSLQKLSREGRLDTAGNNELNELSFHRQNAMNRINDFLSSQDPKYKESYDNFRRLWRENVTPYQETPILSEMSKKGMTEGITPSEIKNIFAYPSEKVSKILQDIGSSGKTNILYNELQRTGVGENANDLANALIKAKQFGYQKYITPQMEETAKSLMQRSKTQKYATMAGSMGGGYIFGGWPGATAMGALTSPIGRKLFAKAIQATGKK